jgi:hypothetical protein
LNATAYHGRFLPRGSALSCAECENRPAADGQVARLRAFCSKKPDKLFDRIE